MIINTNGKTSKLYKIKDFCIVGDGAHTSIKRQSSGIMYLTSKNFKPSGLELSTVDFISKSDYIKYFGSSKKALITPLEGDVLFGIIGSLGVPYVVKKNDTFGISSSVAILRPKQRLISKYLYYFMTSSVFQGAIEAIKSGVAQSFLSLEMIRSLPLIVPNNLEQERIAAILSAYDDLIENNKRRIALLEKMAEEIYREWFVRMRFSGCDRATFEKGLPKGWSMVKTEKAFKFTAGGTPSKAVPTYWSDGNINWYTPSDITSRDGIFLSQSADKCTEEGLANSSARMFPQYSVMFTSRATIGAIGINTTPACTNQGFISCIPNEHYPLTYLYHWLKLGKLNFELLAGGATFPELSKATFKRMEILTPPQELVMQFEDKVRPMFDQVEILIGVNQKLKKTRDMLLGRLISGKLSVENLDIQFPPSMTNDYDFANSSRDA